jgi:hypothetical protein
MGSRAVGEWAVDFCDENCVRRLTVHNSPVAALHLWRQQGGLGGLYDKDVRNSHAAHRRDQHAETHRGASIVRW